MFYPWQENDNSWHIPPGYEPYDCGRPGCLVIHAPVPKEPSYKCDDLTCPGIPESPEPVNIPTDLELMP